MRYDHIQLNNWESVELGTVCEVVRGGSPRPIIDYITDDSDGVNWLKIGDVKENDKYFTHAAEHIKRSGIPKTREVKAGDLILSNSMSYGRAFITLIEGYIHDGWLRLRCNEKRLDKEYLYYFLTSNLAQNQFKAVATGSVVNNLKSDTVKAVKIYLPPLGEQKRIAAALSMMDDKIKCNEEINDNLLQQLQAIYQRMFSQPSPGDMLEGRLSDICAYSQRRVSVASLSSDSYYSTENMLPGKAGAVAASSLPTIAQTTGCMPGDILISNIRPYFKKIVYCQSECGCSTDVLCFVPQTHDLSLYLFSTLYDDHFFDYMVAGSKGTKMPRGDKQQIMAYPIVLPSTTKLVEFNAIARPLLSQIENETQENKRLASLRDTLLPRLMSGEIDVSDVTL